MTHHGKWLEESKKMSNKAYVLLRIEDLCEKLKLSKPTIYNLMNKNSKYFDPSFPEKIRLTANSVAWIEEQIDDWIDSKICSERLQSQDLTCN